MIKGQDMWVVVDGAMKTLEVNGMNGAECTESFIKLDELIHSHLVWEDNKENFCMNADTYYFLSELCDLKNSVTKMACQLDKTEYTNYLNFKDIWKKDMLMKEYEYLAKKLELDD